MILSGDRICDYQESKTLRTYTKSKSGNILTGSSDAYACAIISVSTHQSVLSGQNIKSDGQGMVLDPSSLIPIQDIVN